MATLKSLSIPISGVLVFDRASRTLSGSGFEHINPPPPPLPPGINGAERYGKGLAEFGATASDRRKWLGDPAERYGRWPLETWVYPSGLQIISRHGVVEEGLGGKK